VYHYLNPRAEWELNYGFAILNGCRMVEGVGGCTIYFIHFVERAAITFFLYIGDGDIQQNLPFI